MRLTRVLSGIAMAAAFSMPALASDFYDFVDSSDGYVLIRPNVLLVEGAQDIRICKFDVSDAVFDAYGAQDDAAFAQHKQDPICIPLVLVAVKRPHGDLMNSFDLNRFVDTSESYENIRADVVLIEGESDIKFCKFSISDGFFAAYGANDAAALNKESPSVVCIPLKEVAN